MIDMDDPLVDIEEHRGMLAAQIVERGVDVAGSRYGVASLGGLTQHLMDSGSVTTLCGRPVWSVNEPSDLMPPSCSRCLTIVGRRAGWSRHERLDDVAASAVAVLASAGEVHVRNVPADQVGFLRTAIGAGMRVRKLSLWNYMLGSTLFAHSSDVYDSRPQTERDDEMSATLNSVFGGVPMSAEMRQRAAERDLDWTALTLVGSESGADHAGRRRGSGERSDRCE